MILASAIASFRLLIFISSIPCASLAASYSLFSERSPLSRASAMAAEAAGRSTVSMWRS
ncbi:secreted protein [gut metagenome]|uniref:Secreted protein n=1 Tax=gut metagenome TaxID=749906 RepID=J9GIH9_9ZZZZ